MTTARSQHDQAAIALREQLQSKIAKLDQQEDGYLDLVGDPAWPREKITQRLRKIRDDRERLRRQLSSAAEPGVDSRLEAVEILLDLLSEPRELYRLASKRARKVLDAAFFTKTYVDCADDGPHVRRDDRTEPVARVHRLPPRDDQTPALSSRGLTTYCYVEVPGIEPGSFGVLSGLLRAQLAVSLLGPTDHTSKSVRRAQSLIDLAARPPRPGPVGQPSS
jgi:site-specific DNA recombinase